MIMKYSFIAATVFGSTLACAQPEVRNNPQGQEVALQPQIILLKKSSEPTLSVTTQSAGTGASVKLSNTPRVRTQDLPGVGTLPGEPSDLRIKSIQVGTDRNELVYISQGQLNKISTPFEAPQIIDSTGATLKAVGQDLFIQPSSDKPLTVYITNGGQGQSIGLTLVPRTNLPAQSLVLQLDAPAGSPAVKAEVEEIVASDYVSRITALVRTLALDRTPAGFTRSRLPTAVVSGRELVIEPQHKYAGSSYDLYSYRVKSVSQSPLEMREEAFYSEVVRAVAFYPSALLQAGEETFVFVIADRPAKEGQK
jgi:conjugal transfer pilus assembly protein TraK